MSYNKTTWATGDIVTAEKLNNIESGIANNNIYMVSIIHSIDESTGDLTATFDKTWQEIFDATQSGRLVKFIQTSVEEYPDIEELHYEIGYIDLISISYGPEWVESEEAYIDSYSVMVNFIGMGLIAFKASDPNDYPIMADQK